MHRENVREESERDDISPLLKSPTHFFSKFIPGFFLECLQLEVDQQLVDKRRPWTLFTSTNFGEKARPETGAFDNHKKWRLKAVS